MSKAAELIAGLHSQAEFDSAGGFSLDRDKARQKMRQFQLADPHRYVLLLTEFAALRGATRISFDIDADDMRMSTDAVLDYADLDELYTSLFVDRNAEGIRARRELALACNAVMALNPKFVEITSFGPAGGVKAVLEPDAPDEISKVEAAQPNGTNIHVRDRFRPGLLIRFIQDQKGSLPEELLLRERCRWSSLAITLDGTAIGGGLPTHLIAAVSFETAELRGVGGIDVNQLDRSGIVLISNGVEIATHELTDGVPGLWFWVDGRALHKDVSQNDIARGDDSYTALLATVASARDQVLGKLTESWQTGKFGVQTKPSADDVFKLLSRCFMRWANHEWLRPDAGPLGRLADLPLWRTTTDTWLDSRTVSAQRHAEGCVVYSRKNFDGVVPEGWAVVLHPWSGEEEIAAIGRVFVEFRDATSELDRKVVHEKARRRWRGCPHEPRLPHGHWPVRMPFEVGADRGEVSLRPGRRTNVRVIVDGCMLHEVEFEGPLIGISAVIEGPYEPLADYSRVRQDSAWAAGLLILLAQVPPLLEAWAKVHLDSGDYLRTTLTALCDPTMPARWLEAFGFKSGASLISRLGAPVVMPGLGLDRPASTGAIAELVRLETVDRRKVSLIDLERERHVREYQRGRILVVVADAAYVADAPGLVVRAAADDRRMLEAVFGPIVYDDTETLHARLARQEFESRPKLAPRRPDPSTCSVAIEDGGMRGFVGIDAAELRRTEGGRMAAVELIFESRRLGQAMIPCALAGVRASLEWPTAQVNAQFTGIAGPSQPVQAVVHRGLLACIREQVERCVALRSRPAGDLRRLVWAALTTSFPSEHHYACWQSQRGAHSELAGAVAAYWTICELSPQHAVGSVGEALALLAADRRPPTLDAVVELLGPASRPAVVGEHAEFRRGLLELFATVERVPMFQTAADGQASIADVGGSVAKSGTIGWIQDPALRSDDESELMVRLDVDDRTGLAKLFGTHALVESSAKLRSLAQRQQFSTRRALDRVELEASNRMVAVGFAVDGFEGQLAIPPWPPGEGGSMSVMICHQRRPIETVEVHSTLPVLAIVDDSQVEFAEQYVKVAQTSTRMALLRKQLDAMLSTKLLPALADGYPALAPGARSIAWAWITEYLLRTAEGAGEHPSRLGELGRRFAELPGFVDIDGQPRSLSELTVRYHAAAKPVLLTLERPSTRSAAVGEPVLLLRAEDQEVIGRMFGNVVDYAPLMIDAADGHDKYQRAPPVDPAAIPAAGGVFVRVELEQHGLGGALWIPIQHPFDPGVAIASRGRLVERAGLGSAPLIAELPIQGLVVGEIASDRRFSKAEFTVEQRRYLTGRVFTAYSRLVELHRAELDHPERIDTLDSEATRVRSLRLDILRKAAVALAQSQRRGTPEDAIKANLRERLAELPLLRLTTGRLISITVGHEVRPIELAQLDLWDVDPAGDAFEAVLLGELAEASSAAAAAPVAITTEVEAEPRSGLAMLAGLMGIGAPTSTPPVAVTPPPEQTAEPIVEPVDQVGEVLEAIRSELRLVRRGQEHLLGEGLLDKIRATRGRGRGPLVAIDGAVVFDAKHPCFERALAEPDDPAWVSFLTSVAYTALNHWQEEVTDANEVAFHASHAALLVSGVLNPAVDA